MIDKAGSPPRRTTWPSGSSAGWARPRRPCTGSTSQKIHFHEVGAVDSIVDIVGAAVGLDLLGVDRFEASPVPPGRGWVRAAHGKMPLPAPGDGRAAQGRPAGRVDRRDGADHPHRRGDPDDRRRGVRPAAGDDHRGDRPGRRHPGDCPTRRTSSASSSARSHLPADADRVWVLETNLDDLPGEVVGYTTTQLLAAGALDAFVTPIQMKKNRPGVMVSVLCDEAKIAEMEEILFRETTTLGVRRYPVSRHKLRRQAAEVATPFGPVKGKLGWIEGRPPTFSPEHDDCAGSPPTQGVPLREVYDAAHAAYRGAVARPAAGTSADPRPSARPRSPPPRIESIRRP